MRRPLRSLLWAAALCALVAFAAATFVGWLVATTAGSDWVLQRVLQRLPGTVEASVADGRLLGPLTLREIRYVAGPAKSDAAEAATGSESRLGSGPQVESTLRVTVERLEVDWRPLALLQRHLWIDSMAVNGLTVDFPPSDEPLELTDLRLPIPARLDSLVLDDCQILIGSGPPTVVEQMAVSATATGDRVELHQFALRAAEATLAGSGTVTTSGDYPLDLQVDWTLGLSEDSTLTGGGNVGGSLQEIRIDQRLVAPVEIPVHGKILTPLDKPTFEFTALLEDLDPQAIDATLPALRLNGTVDFRGAPDDYLLSGDIDLDSVPSPQGELAQGRWQFDGRGDLSRFILDRLQVGLRGGEIQATGELSWDPDPAWNLEVTATAADPSSLLPDWPGQIDFSGHTAGHLGVDGPSLSAAVTGLAGQVRGTPIRGDLQVRIDKGRYFLDRLQIGVRGGEIQATGELAWDPVPAWDLQLTAAAIDPSVLLPDWPGRVDFSGTTVGSLAADGPDFSATITELAGQLRGHPIDGDLKFKMAAGNFDLARLDLTSETTRFEASGSLGEAWDLTWGLTLDDLAAFHPRSRGQLQAAGTILGPRATPRTRFRLDGRDLEVNDFAVEHLTADADIDLAEGGPFQFTAVARKLSGENSDGADIRLELDGTRDSHQLALTVTTSSGTVHSRARGDLEGDLESVDTLAWSGQLARLDFDLGELGDWRLQSAVALFADADSVDLARACWRSSTSGSACVEADWSATDGWKSSGSLASLPLQLFKQLLPEKLGLEGSLNADYSASVDPADRLRLELTAAATGTAGLIEDGVVETTRPFSARVSTARVDDAGVHIQADVSIAGGQVDLAAVIPGYQTLAMPSADQQIEGALSGRIQDISPLEPFLLGVKDLQGSIDLDSQFRGPISAPRMEGRAVLRATMALPTLGITLERIDLTATGHGSGRLDLEGEIQSADGSTLLISGSTPSLAQAASPSILRLEGDSFQIVDLPEARIWISPDLEISVSPDSISVAGEILVPRAALELAQQTRGAVTISEDVVIVGGPVAATSVGTRTSADLRLTLGDAVQVRGDGFEATLGGGLRIRQSPGQPPTAEGTLLVLRGKYRGYNQDLRIEDGKILFSGGPIDDPALDIAAFRRARDGVIAGIRLRGSLDAPQVSLYSTPPMPEAEILSYVMRGKGSSPGMSNDMSEAATSLGLAQSTAVLNSLGLKNISVESDGTIDEAALVLGTYLAPNFYVSYGVGLFEAVNTFRMRYEFSDRWMVETDTSEEGSGADISFTIEK